MFFYTTVVLLFIRLYLYIMKRIIDFYENEIVTTPANTTGMGNPMPATDTTNGSEPLVNKKKTAKCKKEKISEASILGDIDDTLNASDEVIEFAQWMIDCTKDGTQLQGIKTNDSLDLDADTFGDFLKCISSPSKGTFILDVNKIFKTKCPAILYCVLCITENSLKNLPKGLKTIKIYNFNIGAYQVRLFTNDMSKLNVEIYSDSGKSYGNLEIACWSKLKNKDIKLGTITCTKFILGPYQAKIESLMLGKDSIIIEADLSTNENLIDVYGRFEHAMIVKFPRQLVARQLAMHGLIPHGCELRIYN